MGLRINPWGIGGKALGDFRKLNLKGGSQAWLLFFLKKKVGLLEGWKVGPWLRP